MTSPIPSHGRHGRIRRHGRFRRRLSRPAAGGSRSPAATAAAVVAIVLALPLCATACGGAGASPSRAGAERAHPTVVQRWVGTFPGLEGHKPGPRSITVRFPQPTRPGDLLVAGVDDGVETSGMVHAHYLLPGWHRAVTTIGGEEAGTGSGGYATGGLQAAIFYYPDNPGGISTVRIASIPEGTLDWVSAVLVELSGVPHAASVDTTGASTNGPAVRDYSQVSTVQTSRATAEAGELAVAVFNNGDNSPHGVRFVSSPGWTVVGEVHDPDDNEQPILLDYRIERQRSVASETDRYIGGYPIDNCAVIAALR